MSEVDRALERRSKDLETADHCLSRAQDALDDEDVLEAIGELGSAIAFASQSIERQAPVATALVERAGNHPDRWAVFYPGETKTIEIDGKAKITIQAQNFPGDGR